jgi:hypothetical protein
MVIGHLLGTAVTGNEVSRISSQFNYDSDAPYAKPRVRVFRANARLANKLTARGNPPPAGPLHETRSEIYINPRQAAPFSTLS